MKLTFVAITAALIGTASFASETVNFDGCEAKLVPGTNYYNLVDPRCKTVSEQFSSSPGEDARRERAEALLAAKDE